MTATSNDNFYNQIFPKIVVIPTYVYSFRDEFK